MGEEVYLARGTVRSAQQARAHTLGLVLSVYGSSLANSLPLHAPDFCPSYRALTPLSPTPPSCEPDASSSMSGSAPKHACHDPFLKFLTLLFLTSPEVAIYALPEARRPTRSGPTRSRDITAVRSHM